MKKLLTTLSFSLAMGLAAQTPQYLPKTGGTLTGSLNVNKGSSGTPTTNLSFANPTLNVTQYDASPVSSATGCGGTSPSGLGNYAPLVSTCLFEAGSNTAGVRYDYAEYLNGFTGAGAIAGFNLVFDHGSYPSQMIGPNVVMGDNSALDINSCSVTASVATCNFTSAFVQSQWPNGTVLWVSGNSGTGINSGRISFAVSASTSTTLSFNCSAQGCSGSGTGGSIRHYHSGAWMLETDAFNNSYNPGAITPVVAQNVTPWHGITSTSIGIYPISTGFFANGSVYEGYLCQDAYDACFVAGYPLQGAGDFVNRSSVGFENRPLRVATAGANYSSRQDKFTYSFWDGSSYAEKSFLTQADVDAGTNAPGHWSVKTPDGTKALTVNEDHSVSVPGPVTVGGRLDVTANSLAIAQYTPPSSSSSGTTGTVFYDSNYVYICVAPNTWKRAALSTF